MPLHHFEDPLTTVPGTVVTSCQPCSPFRTPSFFKGELPPPGYPRATPKVKVFLRRGSPVQSEWKTREEQVQSRRSQDIRQTARVLRILIGPGFRSGPNLEAIFNKIKIQLKKVLHSRQYLNTMEDECLQRCLKKIMILS